MKYPFTVEGEKLASYLVFKPHVKNTIVLNLITNHSVTYSFAYMPYYEINENVTVYSKTNVKNRIWQPAVK